MLASCSGANLDGGVSDADLTERAKASQGSASSTEALGPFEQGLVGTWGRYHKYDRSEEYYIFNSDARDGS